MKYFRNYSLRKRWIPECIGGLVSEHASTVNVLTRLSHYTGMEKRNFILLFQHSSTDKVRNHDLL